jgi:SAM-dependent methyltransferase
VTINRNFDPVAHIYDETRTLPEPVREAGIPAILATVGAGARLLDGGTGTGRLAVPLREAGADIVGVDLSRNMMARQQAKQPAAKLVMGSVTALPFGDGRFDAVLTAHVLHLIPDWQAALVEFRRVLRPGGLYLNVRSESTGHSAWRAAGRYWGDWLMARGGLPHGEHVGAWDQDEINPVLAALGATVTRHDVVTYTTHSSLRRRVEGIRNRQYSSSWDVPAALLAESADALEAWMVAEYGGLDVEQADEQTFRLHVAQFA